MMKDLLRTADLGPRDVEVLLDLAAAFKRAPFAHRDALANESVVLYFNKPSMRTRLSLETAVARLGGVPIMVGRDELQLGRGETIEDTARVVSRYARAFVIRTYSDVEVYRFAGAAAIPVVNTLTDGHHPLQSLADLFTLAERFGHLQGPKVAYLSVGNNVVHSLMEAIALAGAEITLATPAAYACDTGVVARAQAVAEATVGKVRSTREPEEAATGVDAVYTDAWLSMGDREAERAARLDALAPYRVDRRILSLAKPGAIFMHCLPDHRCEEVTAEIIDGPQSVVFDQAENRLHTAAAVLLALSQDRLDGGGGGC